MNRLALLVAAVCFVNPALAGTPEQTVADYLNAMDSSDFSRGAGMFAKSDCEQYKTMMLPLFELQVPPGQQDIAGFLFGRSMNAQVLQSTPACEFVARSVEAMMRMSRSIGAPITEQTSKVLGSVQESESLIHFLVRGGATVGGAKVSSVDVVSVRREGEDWRIQMSGKMKGMSSVIAGALNQQGGADPSLQGRRP